MAIKLGELIIELVAKTNAFTKGMQSARDLSFQSSGDIVSSFEKIGRSFGKLRFENGRTKCAALEANDVAKAQSCAERMLAKAEALKEEPHGVRGDTLNRAHNFVGRVALRKGDGKKAKQELLANCCWSNSDDSSQAAW